MADINSAEIILKRDRYKMKEMKNPKNKHWWFKHITGIIMAAALIIVMLVTSVEIAAYADFGFYEKEYTKYNVNDPTGIVNVEMDELVRVTVEMMSYLRGDRDDMVIYATVDGTEKEMFNAVEKYHMADVRSLFIKGLFIRRICIAIIILGITGLSLMYGFKNSIKSVLLDAKRVIMAVWAAAAVIVAAAVIDFTKVFYLFHYIFFDNMAWQLDGSISRLINMLPEGFFVDIAIRIGVIYILLNLIIIALAFWVKRGKLFSLSQNKKIGGTYEQG
jgi:integral membrane protein (TIGR01906 family)